MDRFLRNQFSRFECFELSLRDSVSPLGIDSFNRWGKPIPCLPMIWVYGCPDLMPMALPLAMIEFPRPELNLKGFEECQKEHVDIWMLIHNSPKRAPCQKASHDLAGEEKLDEINLSHHAWVFGGLDDALDVQPDLNITSVVQTGIFNVDGAFETHQDLACGKYRGLPFGRMESREVVVHDQGRFSPCNNMLRLDSSKIYHSFISKSLGKICRLGKLEENVLGGALILHIVPAHEEAGNRIHEFTSNARSLVDIHAALHLLDKGAYETFNKMLRRFAPDVLMAIHTPSKQRLEKYRSMIAGDLSWRELKPWCPTRRPIGDSGENTSMGIVASAQQMIDLGYPDFAMNVEVLTAVGGNVENALQVLVCGNGRAKEEASDKKAVENKAANENKPCQQKARKVAKETLVAGQETAEDEASCEALMGSAQEGAAAKNAAEDKMGTEQKAAEDKAREFAEERAAAGQQASEDKIVREGTQERAQTEAAATKALTRQYAEIQAARQREEEARLGETETKKRKLSLDKRQCTEVPPYKAAVNFSGHYEDNLGRLVTLAQSDCVGKATDFRTGCFRYSYTVTDAIARIKELNITGRFHEEGERCIIEWSNGNMYCRL